MLKEQLRKARKAAGKTQQEVADHLGVNFSTYSGYETGKRQPDALKIKKIAAFLGVTGDYLLETGMDRPCSVPKKSEKNSRIAEFSLFFPLHSGEKSGIIHSWHILASYKDRTPYVHEEVNWK